MPALFHTLGPIYHFIRARVQETNTFISQSQGFKRQSGPWLFLGTSEVSPEVESNASYLNVMNDIGGRTIPMQLVYDRQQDLVTTTINRLNYTTYNVVRSTRPFGGGVPAEFYDAFEDNGALTFQNFDYELALVYGFSTTGNMAPDTPRGRVYYSAVPKKFKETSAGTRVQTVGIIFECNSLYSPEDRSFRLYTEDPTYWANATPE